MSDSTQKPLGILLINHNWFTNELKALGHRVVTSGWAHRDFDIPFERLTHIDDILAKVPTDMPLDWIVYFDDSHAVSVRGLENVNSRSLFYSIDVHHHAEYHSAFAELFDVVLVAQKDYLSRFSTRSSGPEGWLRWMPLWATLAVEPAAERDVEVCFRGTMDPSLHPQRAEFFTRLKEQFGDRIDAASGPWASAYPRAKIVLNQNVGGDLNFRVFEAIICGALLITPRTGNGMSELFEDGTHLVSYDPGDIEGAAKLVSRYLEDETARNRIAHSGRQLVLAKHSPAVRARQFLEILQSAPRREKPRRQLAAALAYLYSLQTFREAIETTTDVNRSYRDRLVQAASRALLASASAHEPVDEEFRAAALLCRCFLEVSSSQEALLEFSESIRRAAPNDLLLTLSYMEDLMRAGRDEDARALALEFVLPADELLRSVPALMAKAREEVLTSLRAKLER